MDVLQTKVQILTLEYFLTYNEEKKKQLTVSKEDPFQKSFQDHLSGLNDDWHKLLHKARHCCMENEQVCSSDFMFRRFSTISVYL